MVTPAWNGFNVLHVAASRVAGLDMGFVPAKGGKDVAGILAAAKAGTMKLVWLLGADEINTQNLSNSFVVYQGHHGDKGAHCADVILPGAAWCEKDGLYVNFEGRVQLARRAIFPPGMAKDDWRIIRAFAGHLNITLPFDNLDSLRALMIEKVRVFGDIDKPAKARWAKFGRKGNCISEPITAGLSQFYMTCPISRTSQTMAECHQATFDEGTIDDKMPHAVSV